MIDKTAAFFEGFAKNLGLSIKIPRPGKTMRKVSVITNSTVGIGLLVGGIVVSSKVLICLGVLGLAGAIAHAIKK